MAVMRPKKMPSPIESDSHVTSGMGVGPGDCDGVGVRGGVEGRGDRDAVGDGGGLGV